MISLQSKITIRDDTVYSEKDIRVDWFSSGITSYSVTAQDYDDQYALVSAVSTAIGGITMSLSNDGYVTATAALTFRPKFYPTSDIANASKYNPLWQLLGFDSSLTYSYATSHTSTLHPYASVWLPTLHESAPVAREAVVDQSVGIRGHVKQVGRANLTSKKIEGRFLSREQRRDYDDWYAAVLTGSKLSVYDDGSLIESTRWMVDESNMGGINSTLVKQAQTLDRYAFRLLLRKYP